MNNLIQAITDYTTALEQKLSALEARVAQLEEANEAMRREGDEAKALIATLQAEVATLASTGVVTTPAEEPEVEIELIVEEPQEQETPEELVEESAETPQEVPVEEMPLEPLESLEIIEEEEPVAEPVVEPVTVTAPAPQPVQSTDNLAPSDTPSVKPIQPAKGAQPLQTSLFGTAVEDIRQAISLGDRFLFQRELFAGNGELMQKTLDELNALGSLEEAMDYVADNFEWDSDSTAVQLFENVLKRRFS
jgi:outer membrane biosynthesis protein TonB